MKQLFILSVMLTLAAFSVTAQEKEIKQKTVSVTGTAETEVVPDEIYVQVDLREYDKKGVGKISIDSIKSNFLAACQSIGIGQNDISVQSYTGDGNNYWQIRKGRKKDPDMKTGISYWVKLSSTKKMDELVDRLDDEATQNFFIAKTDYSKKEELKKQLKIEAIKAARNKAIYLTEAIDEHIGEALTINDVEDAGSPLTYFISQNASRANTFNKSVQDNDSTDVGFNKIKFQFQVSVVFVLK